MGRPQRMVITRMATADIPTVVRIERESFTTTWPANSFYNELTTNKLAHYFVGRIDGILVAYGGIWVVLEDSHITTIAVDPRFRNQRLGEALMLHLVNEAIERDAAWMTLEVRESNIAAQQLYRKYGFTTVTTRRGYYSDNSESALVMWAGNMRGDMFRSRIAALRAHFNERN